MKLTNLSTLGHKKDSVLIDFIIYSISTGCECNKPLIFVVIHIFLPIFQKKKKNN